ncbi:FKBP-type peptidyl-prolyl cis-trans isomerase [Streptomyces lavendulocolor]|uniref:FKBP-type peptidyl-prolyl cis-trans isomerase n=1 Tax=Streptomyces lavendulocolor TaxID=67316 RepID=UPI0033C545F1
MIGKSVGSRIEVQGPAEKIVVEKQTSRPNEEAKGSQVWVVDVVSSVRLRERGQREVKPVAPDPGMPSIQNKAGAPTNIKIPKGEKSPKKLRIQRLHSGNGPTIKTGDALVVHYTAAQWNGKVLGSSWKDKNPVALQVGTGAVMKGIDEALIGKNIGDRLAVVIPPAMASGSAQQNGKAEALVFVVDLLARL